MILIEVKGVSKRFGKRNALSNINLVIKEGECLGILGRSRAGKSVLLKMLRGMKEYAPDEGTILYHVSTCPYCGRVELPSMKDSVCPKCGKGTLKYQVVDYWRSDAKLREFIRERIAIMFQRTFALYGNRTPLENVMDAIKRAGATTDEGEMLKDSLELIKSVRLIHRILHPAELLSGGEKQRVVLARQIALKPILLLADEPTGTLDPTNAALIQDLLKKEVKNKGVTILVASHLPHLILDLADKVLWLDKGRIIKKGPTKKVLSEFLSTSPHKHFTATVKKGEEILKVKEIVKYYYSIDRGLVKAVDGVSFQVYEGEIFGIMGISGAGKTTLSRIIAGITEPSSGEVLIRVGDEWVDITKPGPKRAKALKLIGILHQEYALYPYRTVLENLTGSIGLELPAALARLKAIYTLKGLGFSEDVISEVLSAYPDELSEGERHRVASAQVLIKEPKLVILDEPSGTMDPITKVEVAHSLRKAKSDLNQTFLVVSHDTEFIKLVCDRVAVMHEGRVLKIIRPTEINELPGIN